MHRITAGLVAGGTFLCIVATPLLLAAAYAKLMWFFDALRGVTYTEAAAPGSAVDGLAWAGWLCLGVGATMLAVGLYRLIAHRHVTSTPAP